jgi:hypothetical protein
MTQQSVTSVEKEHEKQREVRRGIDVFSTETEDDTTGCNLEEDDSKSIYHEKSEQEVRDDRFNLLILDVDEDNASAISTCCNAVQDDCARYNEEENELNAPDVTPNSIRTPGPGPSEQDNSVQRTAKDQKQEKCQESPAKRNDIFVPVTPKDILDEDYTHCPTPAVSARKVTIIEKFKSSFKKIKSLLILRAAKHPAMSSAESTRTVDFRSKTPIQSWAKTQVQSTTGSTLTSLLKKYCRTKKKGLRVTFADSDTIVTYHPDVPILGSISEIKCTKTSSKEQAVRNHTSQSPISATYPSSTKHRRTHQTSSMKCVTKSYKNGIKRTHLHLKCCQCQGKSMVPIWHPDVTCVPSDKTYGYDSETPKSAAMVTEKSTRESVSKNSRRNTTSSTAQSPRFVTISSSPELRRLEQTRSRKIETEAHRNGIQETYLQVQCRQCKINILVRLWYPQITGVPSDDTNFLKPDIPASAETSNKVSALRKREGFPTSNTADPFVSTTNQSSVGHRPVRQTRSSVCTTGKHQYEIQASYLHLMCRHCQKKVMIPLWYSQGTLKTSDETTSCNSQPPLQTTPSSTAGSHLQQRRTSACSTGGQRNKIQRTYLHLQCQCQRKIEVPLWYPDVTFSPSNKI